MIFKKGVGFSPIYLLIPILHASGTGEKLSAYVKTIVPGNMNNIRSKEDI